MGTKLMEEFPTFVDDIRVMDRTLSMVLRPPSWTIEGTESSPVQTQPIKAFSNKYTGELLKPKKTSRVHLAEFAQPLCTAIQIALINLLQSWNIFPSAVMGHSSGEIAAGYACNALTAEEAITISYYRGEATKNNKQLGGMAAVGLGRDEVTPYLAKGVVIACENSPSSVTLSGDLEALGNVVARLKDELPEVFVRQLHVNMAYHSRTHLQSMSVNNISKLIKTRPHASRW
jgi:acyl transferase domain-containing protein